MDIKTFKLIAKMVPPNQSILVRGPTGIGKSAVVASIARDLDMPMVDVRAAVMQEGDFNGIPNIERIRETGIASNAMYGWFVRACQQPVVLFLDEFPRAMMPVLQGSLQLVLDRALSNDEQGMPYTLHPDTRVIAAGNFGAEYEGEDLDPAMLRRFLVVDLESNTDEWVEWAREGNVDPVIVDFIREHPMFLRKDPGGPDVNPGDVCPNPATWHQLSNNYRYAKIAPIDWAGGSRPAGAWAIALGMIGAEAAGKLMDYIERYSLLLTATDVLDKFAMPKIKDRVVALDTADVIDLSEKVYSYLSEKGVKKSQVNNLMDFCRAIPSEVFMNFWARLSGGASTVPNLANVHKAIRVDLMPIVIKAASSVTSLQSKARWESPDRLNNAKS